MGELLTVKELARTSTPPGDSVRINFIRLGAGKPFTRGRLTHRSQGVREVA